MQKSTIFDFSMQYVPDLYTVKDIAVNMEWIKDDILETEIQPEESATESRIPNNISSVFTLSRT